MAISEQPAASREPRSRPLGGPASATAVARFGTSLAEGLADALWRMAHPLGAHRWRDGYEVDLERGWTQYRGSRCTVCDEPWEGW